MGASLRSRPKLPPARDLAKVGGPVARTSFSTKPRASLNCCYTTRVDEGEQHRVDRARRLQAGADGLAHGQQSLAVEARAWAAHNPGDREDGRAQHRRGQAADRLDRRAQTPGHPRAFVWRRLAAWDS